MNSPEIIENKEINKTDVKVIKAPTFKIGNSELNLGTEKFIINDENNKLLYSGPVKELNEILRQVSQFQQAIDTYFKQENKNGEEKGN